MTGKSLLHNIAESANPVFIKEMRQYFQNRRMLFFIGIMLLVQFVFTIFFSSATAFSYDAGKGVTFFLLIICAGAILSVLICALGAGFRFEEERSDKELNYTMLTTLKPSSVILGKLEGAMMMLLCIFSLLLPFLTAAYFMRGISVASLLLVIILFPALVMGSLFGILAGAFGKRWITILYLVGMFNFILGIIPFWFTVAREVMTASATTPAVWTAIAIEYGLALLFGILIFLISAAVIAPPKSNRLFAVKIYIFCLPFITLGALLATTPLGLPNDALFILECLFTACAISTMLLMAFFEPPEAGIRVYMKCPRNITGRIFHFIFSTGYTGSIILAILLMLIPAGLFPFMGFSRPGTVVFRGFLCILLTGLNASLLSILLAWRFKLLRPWIWAIIFHFGANAAVLLAAVYCEGFDNLPKAAVGLILTLSPAYTLLEMMKTGFSGSSNSPLSYGMFYSGIVSGLLLLALLPTFFRSFKLHRRPSESEAIKTPTPEMLKK